MTNWIKKHKALTGIAVLVLVILLSNGNKKADVNPSTQKKSVSTMKLTPTEYEPKGELEREAFLRLTQAAKPKLKVSITFTSTYLSITNDEEVELTECVAWLPKYSTTAYGNEEWITLTPHQTKSIAWGNLTLDDGTRFNYFETKPHSVEITCTLSSPREERSQIFSL